MKITDLKIGQFATRNWYNNKGSLCVKRYSSGAYEYWENGQFSSVASNKSSIFRYTDFKLCDHNCKLIEEFTYPLYMESIGDNSVTDRVVKFVSLTEGTVIIQGNSITLPSHRSTSWIEHTSSEHWKPCDFSKAPEVEDIDYWNARHRLGLSVYYSQGDHSLRCKLGKVVDPSDFKVETKFYISDASQPDISSVTQEEIKLKLNNDALDALSYTLANSNWKLEYLQPITGATENVVNNLNQSKEFTMNNELKDAILELIATNGQPKVKKQKTPTIVCNVDGTLMEFADETELKSFMWSSRVEYVIRYDLAGKVTVPFELSVEAPKTKASK